MGIRDLCKVVFEVKRDILSTVGLLLGILSSIIAGFAILVIPLQRAPSAADKNSGIAYQIASATVVTYEELKQPWTLCSVDSVGPDENVVLINSGGSQYVFNEQFFAQQTGLTVPQLHASVNYQYTDNTPCKTAREANTRIQQDKQDKQASFIELLIFVPLAIVGFGLAFRKNKPKSTDATFSGYWMRLRGTNQIITPFAPVNISVQENGDVIFSGNRSERVEASSIRKVRIANYGMVSEEPMIRIDLNDGTSILINENGSEAVTADIKAYDRYILTSLTSQNIAVAGSAKQMVEGAQTTKQFSLPLLYSLQSKLGKKVVGSVATQEEKGIKLLITVWAFYCLTAAALLVLNHHTSNPMKAEDLLGSYGFLCFAITLIAVLLFAKQNYKKEIQLKTLLTK